jgi:hypothetical protein
MARYRYFTRFRWMSPLLVAALLTLQFPAVVSQQPREFSVFHGSLFLDPALRQASMSSVPAGAVSFFPSTVKVTSGIFRLRYPLQIRIHVVILSEVRAADEVEEPAVVFQ